MPELTPKALIVGYGNPLRGDDGAGAAIAKALSQAALENVEVVICHQLTPELAERLATVDMAVFVDAQAGAVPGSIAVARLQNDTNANWTALVHHVNAAALLSMSATLFGRSPKAFIVTIAAGSFELNEGLSERVALALPDAIEAVRRLILDERHGG